jgi:tRNA threonylcarbamoyl adenosine modification protein (Sua5/YciO/YrdC/YwlC family)
MQTISLDRTVPEIWTIGPAARALAQGELVVIPTDTIYALACDPWNPKAVANLYAAKGMDKTKRCAIVCRNLKDVGAVSRAVGDRAYRFLKQHLPGPYTVLLDASWDLPRKATGKRKTIGVRIPDHPVCEALAEDFDGPILVTSMPHWITGEELDPMEIAMQLYRRPAVVLDQGPQIAEPSTVVDFTVDPPELIRLGKGEIDLED